MDKFIKDPENYKPVIEDYVADAQYHVGTMPGIWTQVGSKGCTVKDARTYEDAMASDGIMGLSDYWNGPRSLIGCMTQCKHTAGCIGVDVFKKQLKNGYNCALYRARCEKQESTSSTYYEWDSTNYQRGDGADGGCTEKATDPWVAPAIEVATADEVSSADEVNNDESTPIDTSSYFLSAARTACTAGSIESEEDCRKAAVTIDGKVVVMAKNGAKTFKNFGYGCFVNTNSGKMFWNYATSGSPKPFQKFVCQSE